jgi:prepilin peptidase CpaA
MNGLSIFALAVGVLASICDVRHHKIPNVLTFGAALLACAAHLMLAGPSGITVSVEGWLLGIALFFPFFALGGLGAGDVKLLGALGAWLGPGPIVFVALYSTLVGGVIALVVALNSGYLSRALRNIKLLVTFWMTVGFKPAEELTLAGADAPRVAYAVPMLAGLVMTLWTR